MVSKQTQLQALDGHCRTLSETVAMMHRINESLLRSIDRSSEFIEASLREIAKANALLGTHAADGMTAHSSNWRGSGIPTAGAMRSTEGDAGHDLLELSKGIAR